jgi:hypothetical protein
MGDFRVGCGLWRIFLRGPAMMGYPPRVPVDLQQVTRDVKHRCARRPCRIDIEPASGLGGF